MADTRNLAADLTAPPALPPELEGGAPGRGQKEAGPGSRFHGDETGLTARPISWKCPSCQTEQVGRPEAGCTACGAGTPEANAAAAIEAERKRAERAATQVAQATRRDERRADEPLEVSEDVLVTRVLRDVVAVDYERAPGALALVALTPQARQTVGRALVFMLENDALEAQDLDAATVGAWSTLLLR